MSLHPRAQYRLVEYFFDAIKRKHIQMIIATHSEHIVKLLPKEAVICLRKNERETYVQQNVIPELAFLEIGSLPINRKRIIVEDEMAKRIVEKVLEEEELNELVSVEFYPGGCSNLKKYTILTFARTNIKSQYVFFDGDQFNEAVPDFGSVLERDKTISYYKDQFRRIVGMRSSTMDWGLDANPDEGRLNEEQEKNQIENYLLFYKSNVFFLPKVIPEDIIYDEEYLRNICGQREFPDLSGDRDSKAKLFHIANSLGISIGSIEQLLISQFIIKNGTVFENLCTIENMAGITTLALAALLVVIGVFFTAQILITDDSETNSIATGKQFKVTTGKDLTGENYFANFSLIVLTVLSLSDTPDFWNLMIFLLIEAALGIIYIKRKCSI